jgi:hypothetical protein
VLEHQILDRSTQASISINITDVDFDEFQRFPYANKMTPLPSVPIIATIIK